MKLDEYKKGAIAGGIIGFIYSIYFRKNKITSILLGGVAGGYAGSMFTKRTIRKTKLKRFKEPIINT